MMLCAVPELDSESVTLSTYYPAPSGVYTNMITTGNTTLARDGGNGTRVGIGTTAPAGKLDVNGTAYFRNGVYGAYGLTPSYAAWNTYGTGDGGAAIYNDAGAYQGLMLVGNNSGGGQRRVKVWDELTVNGTEKITGSVQTYAGAGCTTRSYEYSAPTGGNAPLCPGQYVTTIAGFYTKYIAMPLDRGALMVPPVNNQFNYLCCPCPPGGCGGM